MRTHDVQDIDSAVMEMIRSKHREFFNLLNFHFIILTNSFSFSLLLIEEAVENYLPDNIRPRRAWHLAKASLRTLKRTLNNRKV